MFFVILTLVASEGDQISPNFFESDDIDDFIRKVYLAGYLIMGFLLLFSILSFACCASRMCYGSLSRNRTRANRENRENPSPVPIFDQPLYQNSSNPYHPTTNNDSSLVLSSRPSVSPEYGPVSNNPYSNQPQVVRSTYLVPLNDHPEEGN